MNKETLKLTLVFILVCFLFGSTWVNIRWGLESLTPFFFAGARFLLSSIIFYLVIRFRGYKLPRDKDSLQIYFVMGLFSFVVPFMLIYWGEQYVSAGLGAILFGVFPFIVAIASHIFLPGENIGIYKLVGICLGFMGVVVIYTEGFTLSFDGEIAGMTAIILGASVQAGINVYLKSKARHMHPITINFIPILLAGIFLTTLSFFIEDTSKWVFDLRAILTTSYLAIFGSFLTFTLYFWLLKKMSVVILSLSTFIIPIFAVLLGWLILDETLSLYTFAGSSLVLIGILFANLRGLMNYYRKRN